MYLWLLFACSGSEPIKSTPSTNQSATKVQAKAPQKNKKAAPQKPKKPLPALINDMHPQPLDKSKRISMDVCQPYYQLLDIEAQRDSAKDLEKKRLSALRELNKKLDYHPAGTSAAIKELEKETLDAPITLDMAQRKKNWRSIHLYIGGICRVDLRALRSQK